MTYSTDPTTARAILHPNSPIWIPDLSAFSTPTDRWPTEYVQQTTANALGVSSTAYVWNDADDDTNGLPAANTTWVTASADYWQENNKTWKYVFVDTPPLPGLPDEDPGGPNSISIFTDRTLTSNGSCIAYPINVDVNNTWTFQGNGSDLLPVPGTLDYATTFQASNGVATCNGDNRTASVQVYETGHVSMGDEPSVPYWFYDCCISVSAIGNATDDKPQILPNMSYTAAAAIGLQGYYEWDYPDYQYKIYQNETYWGKPFNGDAEGLANRMAQFAIGVFVTAGYQNPMNRTLGLQPEQGTTISFDQYGLMILALSLLGGLHFLSFIVCAFMANRVVIPDESPLSIARSLGPIVAGLGGRGGLLSSEEIAKILDRQALYGLVEEKNEGLRICFEDVPPVRAFPNGRYV